VLIGVDDVQWLDRASSEALVFAARRLAGHGVRFVLARRPAGRSELERVLERAGVRRVEVASVSVGATGRIIADRLGHSFSRRTLHKVHEGAQGNPLLALELARLLDRRPPSAVDDELPVPDIADDVFGARIRDADEATRRVLLAVALSGDASTAELATVVDPGALEDAVSAGLVLVERARVRPAHPMLAAAARRHATAAERRLLHRRLALASTDQISRARHFALAASNPDGELAASIAAAAQFAADHGRVWEAVALARQALELTPVTDPQRGERLLVLARLHLNAGDSKRVTELLRARTSELAPGRQRATASLLLAQGSDVDVEGAEELVSRALAEGGDDASVRAWAFALRADMLATSHVARLDEAQNWARQAVAAQSGNVEIDRWARAALTWTQVLRGQPPDHADSDEPAAGSVPTVIASVDRPLGVRLAFRGELERARAVFRELEKLAEDRGELHSIGAITLQKCEVEIRAGRLPVAAELRERLGEVLRDADVGEPAGWPAIARLNSLNAAVAGDPEQAARWAAEVLDPTRTWAIHESRGWDRLEARRALGIVALFRQQAELAVDHLRHVWEHTRREHVDDPGAFPAAGDLIEALVRSGSLDEASGVVEQLDDLARSQDHPWALATVQRGRALVALARADDYPAEDADALVGAADAYGELGLDFDRARSLLSLGIAQRRFKKRGAARVSLGAAVDVFERCGSTGWATLAREELDRVSGRRAASETELTPTERRVAELAMTGLSNKEIAAQLFVSVNTVEGHLSRTYAKLGVRSRRRLVEHLSETREP
jgi:DNA-binding CsgD family transcriptional regulator/tetratricopeptide (TPR) repeat protein